MLKATTGATIKSDYHADVQVQIFDLRRMTQCFPVQFTYQTAPVQMDFLPESNSKCCAMAKNGTLLILDATYDLSQAEVYQGNPSGTISTTFGVSSNGRILAIGDNVGAVHVWTNYNENEINLNPEDGIKATYYDQPLAELPQFYAPDPVCSAMYLQYSKSLHDVTHVLCLNGRPSKHTCLGWSCGWLLLS